MATDYVGNNLIGIGGRYTYNVRREFAFETSFTFFPQNLASISGQGGRSFGWFTGAKAGIRRQHWGVFGKAAPGLRHFNSVPEFIIPQPFDPFKVTTANRGRTHFAVELGAALEFYLKSKWIV